MSLERFLPPDAYASPKGEEVRALLEVCHNQLDETVARKLTGEDRDLLSEKHENLAAALVAFRTRTSHQMRLTFTEGERLVIDFGILDERLLDTPERIGSFCRREVLLPDEISGFRIRYLTEMIDTRFQAAQGVPQEKTLQRRLTKARVALTTLKQDLKQLQLQRNAIVRDRAKLQPLAELYYKLDKTLPSWARACSRMESAGDISARDRRMHHKLGQEYTALRDAASHLVATLEAETRLSRIVTQITTNTMRIPRSESEIKSLQEAVEAVRKNRQEQSLPAHAVRHADEVREILARLRLCGGSFSRKAHSVLTKGKNLHGKRDIIRAVEAITDDDAELRDKWNSGEWSQPGIGLLPGLGEAVYEEAGNRIWVPILLRKSPERTMAGALANYRLSTSRELLAEFGSLNALKEIKSVRVLREKFVRAYTTWSLRDSKGFRSLRREVRNWFITRIYQTATPEEEPNATTS